MDDLQNNLVLMVAAIWLLGLVCCIVWNGPNTNYRLAKYYGTGSITAGYWTLLVIYAAWPGTMWQLVQLNRYLIASAQEAFSDGDLSEEEKQVFSNVFGNMAYMSSSEVRRYTALIRRVNTLPDVAIRLLNEVYEDGPTFVGATSDRYATELLTAMGFIAKIYAHATPGYVALTADGGFAVTVSRQLPKKSSIGEK